MKLRLCFLVVVIALLLVTVPGFAVSKEIVQLQTQVQQLQDQMARMQQSFDERMGVMNKLVEQQSDATNKLLLTIQLLQQTLAKQQGDMASRGDVLAGQIQSLHDAVDELKARLGKLSSQLDQMAAAGQNISQAPAQGVTPQAPPADSLYANALRDYNSNKLDLATQEFGDYVRYYPTTDLAGNAQFYLAEVEYKQGNYEAAVRDYDKVIEQYPGSNKTPTAQLRKGTALAKLGRNEAAVKELKSLIQRYPKSIEASNARTELLHLNAGAQTGTKDTGKRDEL
jgi:tol-pal system protein YbgF